jgi:hypothetical protein
MAPEPLSIYVLLYIDVYFEKYRKEAFSFLQKIGDVMDAHPPGTTRPRKRLSRKTFLFWLIGIIALLGFMVGLFAAYPLLTHTPATSNGQASTGGSTLSITSTIPFKSTSTVGSSIIAPAALITPTVVAATSGTVAISGSQGNWHLTVNGSPYQIKGVTYDSPPTDAQADMPALRAMGVNTLRIWNTDATTLPLFNAASTYGIKVISGFALSQSEDYLNDVAYKTAQLKIIEQWVNTYKKQPGVLLWDIGNEVLLNLQNTFSGTRLEQERNAYAQFIDQVAQAIHTIDPSHPVTSTDAWTGAWVYYKANAPHLDLYAINAYGSACSIKQNWISGGYSVPYIVTESGPPGEWEVPKDANGVPQEETDVQSSQGYATVWNCITSHTGVALGATLFNYGTENDFGAVWFNLLTDHFRRLSDFTVARLYGGQISTNTPPVISNMTLDKTTVPMNSSFTVSANVSDPNGDALSYQIMLCSKYIDGNTSLRTATFTQTGAGSFSVTSPAQTGVWKVYLYAFDGHGNVGIETLSFKVA